MNKCHLGRGHEHIHSDNEPGFIVRTTQDGLGDHDHDVGGADATGDMMGNALLRVLVDEHEGAEAASSRRDARHEVPRPHMAGVGGLRGDATGGAAAAWPPRLLLRDAEAEDAAQPAGSASGRPPAAPGPPGAD
jgi:hypothetical protein